VGRRRKLEELRGCRGEVAVWNPEDGRPTSRYAPDRPALFRSTQVINERMTSVKLGPVNMKGSRNGRERQEGKSTSHGPGREWARVL